MVATRSGHTYEPGAPAQRRVRWRHGKPAPAGWTSWESWHLCQGAKLAVDYFNIPAGTTRANTRIYQRQAMACATRARHWARTWYEITRGTPNAPRGGPYVGLGPMPASYTTTPLNRPWKCRWQDLIVHNFNAINNWDLATELYWAPWSIRGVGPATRISRNGPPNGGQQKYDEPLRLAARVLPANVPTQNWNQIPIADRQRMHTEVTVNYVPANGHPKVVVNVLQYEGLGMGRFADRLPEFMCQLGTKRSMSDFN